MGVRSISGELPLGRQQLGHAFKQAVERRHQRQHLGRHTGCGQRHQRLRLARGDIASELAQRPHRDAHHPPDAQRQQRQYPGQRFEHAGDAGQHNALPGRLPFADQHAGTALAPRGHKHAPGCAVHAAVGKTIFCRSVSGASGAFLERVSNWSSFQSWNTTRVWCLSSCGASFNCSSSSCSSGCRRSSAAVCAKWASSRSPTSSSASCQVRAAALAQASSTSVSTASSSRACSERGVRGGAAVGFMPRPAQCGSRCRARSRSAPPPACAAAGRCALQRRCC